MQFEFKLSNAPIEFVYITSDEAKKSKKKVASHPERVCIECLYKGETSYVDTTVWRRLKDEKGNVIRKNELGEEIWLCNKHGMTQNNALYKSKMASNRALHRQDAQETRVGQREGGPAESANGPIAHFDGGGFLNPLC